MEPLTPNIMLYVLTFFNRQNFDAQGHRDQNRRLSSLDLSCGLINHLKRKLNRSSKRLCCFNGEYANVIGKSLIHFPLKTIRMYSIYLTCVGGLQTPFQSKIPMAMAKNTFSRRISEYIRLFLWTKSAQHATPPQSKTERSC